MKNKVRSPASPRIVRSNFKIKEKRKNHGIKICRSEYERNFW